MHVNVGAVTLISTSTAEVHLLHFQLTVIQLTPESSALTLLKIEWVTTIQKELTHLFEAGFLLTISQIHYRYVLSVCPWTVWLSQWKKLHTEHSPKSNTVIHLRLCYLDILCPRTHINLIYSLSYYISEKTMWSSVTHCVWKESVNHCQTCQMSHTATTSWKKEKFQIYEKGSGWHSSEIEVAFTKGLNKKRWTSDDETGYWDTTLPSLCSLRTLINKAQCWSESRQRNSRKGLARWFQGLFRLGLIHKQKT